MPTYILVEDEFPARSRLKKLLKPYAEDWEMIGEADNGEEAVALIETHRPDCIFLDIQLPDFTGFEVLKRLSYQPMVVFTTAYTEYALEAFDTLSIDYLVKPFDAKRFEVAMQKLGRMQGKPNSDLGKIEDLIRQLKTPTKVQSIPVKKKDKILLLDVADIVFFQAEDKYMQAFTRKGDKHLLSKTMNELLEILPDHFMRVHRSYLLNTQSIIEIQKYFKGKLILTMNDPNKTQITTGETYSKEVKQVLGL